MVTMENYEEYLLLHADGELGEAEEKALAAFMSEHPELRHEMELYMATKLLPDTRMVYDGKEQLLKKPGKVVAFRNWGVYAAAAGIVLALVLVWKWPVQNTTNNIVVQVNNNHININSTAPKDTIARKQETEEEPIARTEDQKEEVRKEPQASLQVRPKAHHYANEVKRNIPEQEVLASMNVLPMKTLPEAAVQATPKPIAIEVPRVQLPEPEAQNDGTGALLARLPIKQEGISTISNAVNNKLEKVRNLKDNIKNTDLSVRLGNKELFVVRF